MQPTHEMMYRIQTAIENLEYGSIIIDVNSTTRNVDITVQQRKRFSFPKNETEEPVEKYHQG